MVWENIILLPSTKCSCLTFSLHITSFQAIVYPKKKKKKKKEDKCRLEFGAERVKGK